MTNEKTVPWRRLVGEFLVIVIGVLVALGVDAWREQQAERRLAEEHIRGLINDLQVDDGVLTVMGQGIGRKRESLETLRAVAWGDADISVDSIAALLFPSSVYGWRIPAAQNAAYEELKSTGGLRLLEDPDLRSAITFYYENWEHQLERLDRHRSGYPNAAYGLVPADVFRGDAPVGAEAGGLVGRLRTDEMRALLNHELNYLFILDQSVTSFTNQMTSLLERLGEQAG